MCSLHMRQECKGQRICARTHTGTQGSRRLERSNDQKDLESVRERERESKKLTSRGVPTNQWGKCSAKNKERKQLAICAPVGGGVLTSAHSSLPPPSQQQVACVCVCVCGWGRGQHVRAQRVLCHGTPLHSQHHQNGEKEGGHRNHRREWGTSGVGGQAQLSGARALVLRGAVRTSHRQPLHSL